MPCHDVPLGMMFMALDCSSMLGPSQVPKSIRSLQTERQKDWDRVLSWSLPHRLSIRVPGWVEAEGSRYSLRCCSHGIAHANHIKELTRLGASRK